MRAGDQSEASGKAKCAHNLGVIVRLVVERRDRDPQPAPVLRGLGRFSAALPPLIECRAGFTVC